MAYLSLWEMINFNVFKFCTALHVVQSEEAIAGLRVGKGLLTDEDKANVRGVLFDFVEGQCSELELKACKDRLDRMKNHLVREIDWDEWYTLVRTLRETMIDNLKGIACYYYPPDRAEIYWRFMDQWTPILRKFPSITEEAMAAVDCYALDKNTASIFHSMRVAEIGLRALAKERRVKVHKKPLEWAMWQDIINAIRGDVKHIQNAEAGPKRDAALNFYQGALGEFEAFKDVYRNQVMHVREMYEADQALHTLNHVREFMKRLSGKIGENPSKKINWSLRWRKTKNPSK